MIRKPALHPIVTPSLLALALALSATPAAAAAPYAPPSADVLSALEHHHHPHDWWRVTVDSARYEVRVRTVDAAGIAGLKPRHRSDLVPEHIAWSEIARIDARKSHFRSRQVRGVIVGGIGGFVLASLQDLADPLPGLAVFVGAGLGGWLGGLYGDTQVHERPLYISRTLLAPAPVMAQAPAATSAPGDSVQTAPVAVASDSTRAASGSDGASDSTHVAAGSEAASDSTSDVPPAVAPVALGAGSTAPRIAGGAPTPQVLDACRMISPSSILRVRADFGMFEGTAERAEPEGLSGLRMSSLSGAAVSTPGVVSWDRIELVEVRGSNAGSGARNGALVLGALGGMAGLLAIAAVSAAGESSTQPGVLWIAAGAGIGAAAGAVLGGAAGSAGTSWRTVYRR